MVVYILELSGGHYYVGRTENLELRLEEHKAGRGCAWTMKYEMIRLVETYPDGDNSFYENMIVKKMMHKHGIDKVRGGSYSQVILSTDSIRAIEHEIKGASDQCFRCGGNHFIKDCPDHKYEKNDDLIVRVANSGYRKMNRLIKYICS